MIRHHLPSILSGVERPRLDWQLLQQVTVMQPLGQRVIHPWMLGVLEHCHSSPCCTSEESHRDEQSERRSNVRSSRTRNSSLELRNSLDSAVDLNICLRPISDELSQDLTTIPRTWIFSAFGHLSPRIDFSTLFPCRERNARRKKRNQQTTSDLSHWT